MKFPNIAQKTLAKISQIMRERVQLKIPPAFLFPPRRRVHKNTVKRAPRSYKHTWQNNVWRAGVPVSKHRSAVSPPPKERKKKLRRETLSLSFTFLWEMMPSQQIDVFCAGPDACEVAIISRRSQRTHSHT